MNHSVPQWEMEAGQIRSNKPHSNGDSWSSWSDSLNMWDYEVAELTWQNGQLAMHGLGPPRPTSKPFTRQVWERPPASGTLECIVNQGKCMPNKAPEVTELKDFPQLFSDAIVPCSVSDAPSPSWVGSQRVYEGSLDRTPASNIHTGIGSGQGPFISHGEHHKMGEQSQSKRQKLAIVPEISHSNAKLSISGSANAAQDDTCATFDTGDTIGRAGGLTTPIGSVENTSTGKDEQDSVCHSRSKMEEDTENHKGKGHGGRSSRSRAAAVHNQSERKRRDRINQKMKALQKLIPNCSKTDKASVLDEAIEYLRQLQATVQLMSQTSMQQMMMPLPMQQLQMCMLAQMSMGVNAGIRPGHAGIQQILNPCNFMPQNLPVVGAGSSGKPKEMMPGPSMPDPLSTLLTCQPQNMNMDPFKMAALYQQMYQPPSSNSNGLGER